MFRNMEYIYRIYQEKSFSRAAEKLYISQSSLSLTIKKAEERIGAPIFDRSMTPVGLTEFGEKYIETVETIMGLRNDLENFLYDIGRLNRGHISVGAANFCATYLMPSVLTAFQDAFPGVTVELFENTTRGLLEKLNGGQLDMLVSNTELEENQYRRFSLCRERMILAVPQALIPQGELQAAALSFEELSQSKNMHGPFPFSLKAFHELPFLLLRPGNDTRKRADLLFYEAGVKPRTILELDQASTAYRMACSGMGAAIASDLLITCSGNPGNVCFFPLEGAQAQRDVQVYVRHGRTMTRAMEEFIKIARLHIQSR